MADRPIIFSAPMVRALLAGRKTQTRRLVTPGTCEVLGSRVTAKNPAWAGLKFDRAEARSRCPMTGVARSHLGVPWVHPEDEAKGMEADAIYRVDPVIQPGDRLWVKETWCHTGEGVWSARDSHTALGGHVIYRADDDGRDPGIKWFSSLFLPRTRSRLTLLVTDVRVERLNDISEADAKAEGVQPICDHGVGNQHLHSIAFQQLWCSLHGDGAWIANPWVVAITFKVVRANIDALPQGIEAEGRNAEGSSVHESPSAESGAPTLSPTQQPPHQIREP